jgi:hypothetical protein
VNIEATPSTVGIVASLDPEEGPPAAFALLVPVDFELYRDWVNRQEDLSAQFAYRAVAAVTRLLGKLDAAGAPIAYRNFHDCLSIQVWLGNHTVKGDVRKLADEVLDQMRVEALDLASARLDVRTVWVSPFTIAPDDEEESAREERSEEPAAPPPAPVVPAAAPAPAPTLLPPEPVTEGAGDTDPDGQNRKPVKVILRRGGGDDM